MQTHIDEIQAVTLYIYTFLSQKERGARNGWSKQYQMLGILYSKVKQKKQQRSNEFRINIHILYKATHMPVRHTEVCECVCAKEWILLLLGADLFVFRL